jgi:(+)-abscisic acid 8'-hydroxylase
MQYAFNVALLSIFGKDEISNIEELKQCYYTLEKGYNSMPINLPGTLFHKAMKARRCIADIVGNIIYSRRERQRAGTGKAAGTDLLWSFLEAKAGLTDAQISDNVIGVIFAARDTTASVLTWVVKFLGDNPSVLQSVIVSVH